MASVDMNIETLFTIQKSFPEEFIALFRGGYAFLKIGL